jgi:hypothetical protein
MRIFALAIVMALMAQPAWAHHKPNHPDLRPDRPTMTRAAFNPCGGVSNSPHENAALQAMARRCHGLRAELSRNPDDAQLRDRCDRLARALTGRRCTAGQR